MNTDGGSAFSGRLVKKASRVIFIWRRHVRLSYSTVFGAADLLPDQFDLAASRLAIALIKWRLFEAQGARPLARCGPICCQLNDQVGDAACGEACRHHRKRTQRKSTL